MTLQIKTIDRLDGVLVRSDGMVFVPGKGKHAHWTYGSKNNHGYMYVCIKGKTYAVHRLVMEAFYGPCPEGMEVDHRNKRRDDNRVENLRYCSRVENAHNTVKYERVSRVFGVHECEDKSEYHKRYYQSPAGHTAHVEAKKRQNALNKNVRFADGSRRYIPNELAYTYLAIPLSERVYFGDTNNGQ